MILRLTFSEQTTKFPVHSALLNENGKLLVSSSAIGKVLFPSTKGKQTSTCLESFCDLPCSALEVSRVKTALNEFNSL